MTLCERFRYLLICLTIESTPKHDFVQLYRARASTPLTSGIDQLRRVDISRVHFNSFFLHSHTYSLSLTRKHKNVYNFDCKREWHGYLKNDRNPAVGMLGAGTSVNTVALHFRCSMQTNHNLTTRYATTGSVIDRPRSGRPRVTSRRGNRFITFTHLRNRLPQKQ